MYPKLSKREGEAFAAIAFGEANPDIAAALQIIETTVRAHVEYTRSKLGVAAGRRHRLFEDA
ncbi:MAG: LuxR C-terminal-related transcriptional regulator [Planctomycetota bacterium]